MIVLALLGCTPDAPTPPAVEPTEAPAAPTAEAAPHVPTTIWTAKNIRDLVPVAPAHNNAVPKPIPTLPAYDTALATLGEVIDTYDGAPENPGIKWWLEYLRERHGP